MRLFSIRPFSSGLFIRLFAAAAFGLIALTAGATPANPVNGIEYRTLEKPQQTDSGKKVEVIEFFWYACPHCNVFEPSLMGWVKKQGDNIAFKRVPVAFRDSFIPQQKLYYTLEAMGKLEDLHPKVFRAIHDERKSLDTDSAITDFVTKNGIDQKKFLELYNSFGVQTKVRRARQLQTDYQVDGVPMIAINGRYITAPSIVGASIGRQSESALHEATLQVMSALVNKSKGEIGADGGAGGNVPQDGSKKK